MPIQREDVSYVVEMLEKLFKTTLDERGRIYVPKEIRKKLLIKSGDKIFLKMEGDHLILYTTRAIRKKLMQLV